MIAVQAETGRHATPGLSELGEQRFDAIGATAPGCSRRDEAPARCHADAVHGRRQPDTPARPRPAGELVDAARSSGTHVRLTIMGPVVPLPSGVDLCAYRIVQEALTNARQQTHARRCRRRGPALLVRVLQSAFRDDGPGPDGPADSGHGLLGIRERAAMVGGTLHAGPGEGVASWTPTCRSAVQARRFRPGGCRPRGALDRVGLAVSAPDVTASASSPQMRRASRVTASEAGRR